MVTTRALPESDFTAKGGLLIGTASNTSTMLAVGANSRVLMADSAETSGVKWADVPAGADGVSFIYRGAWVSGTAYIAGDWVRYGAALYACNGSVADAAVAPSTDAGWEVAVDPLAPPYLGATQQFFIPGQTLTTVTATSIGVGATRIAPIVIPYGKTIDKLVIEVSTGEASSVARLGVYADTGAGYPGTLLQSGTVACDATGVKSVDITNTASTGLMWLAYKPETSAAGTLAVYGYKDGPVLPYVCSDSTASAANTRIAGYVCSSGETGATMRSTFPTWMGTGFGYAGTAPRVGVVLA